MRVRSTILKHCARIGTGRKGGCRCMAVAPGTVSPTRASRLPLCRILLRQWALLVCLLTQSCRLAVHAHPSGQATGWFVGPGGPRAVPELDSGPWRSEEHTSELQSLMRISYAVFCLKKKTKQ